MRALIFIAVFVATLGGVSAQKRSITEKDLFDFVWIGDPQLAPDGARVAFVRVTVNEKKEGYDTSIWTVPLAGDEEPHQLTNGKHDSTPRWSPDGKFLVFVRAAEKDGKPEPPQLCMLPLAGGDSFAFTDLPKGASSPRWSPDGRTIVFGSSTNADDLTKQEKKKRKEEEEKKAAAESSPAVSPSADKKKKAQPTPLPNKSETESEHESDIHVITRAVYRSDDDGYLDPNEVHRCYVLPRRPAPVRRREVLRGFAEEDAHAAWRVRQRPPCAGRCRSPSTAAMSAPSFARDYTGDRAAESLERTRFDRCAAAGLARVMNFGWPRLLLILCCRSGLERIWEARCPRSGSPT